MNKLEEQAKFVQAALREGKKVAVAVAVPRRDLFERVVRDMIPADLKREPSGPNKHHIKFTNGACLWFVPTQAPGCDVRGIRFDLAYYYLTASYDSIPITAREQERRVVWNQLAEHSEMREQEMP